jgi:UDP-3-O-[3-hydroxymyristoyl] N-acetylglucosamine deacetylase
MKEVDEKLEHQKQLELQHTLAAPISLSGVGIQSGQLTNVKLVPAPPETGLVFKRTDLNNFPIEAQVNNVGRVAYATTLMKEGVRISVVEHLLSSLYIYGIDNAFIEIDNWEVPSLDGCALQFVSKVQEVGLTEQPVQRKYLVIQKPLHFEEEDKSISVFPAESFQISYSIEFNHPLIRKQSFEFKASAKAFATEIAPARTFAFAKVVEEFKKNGYVRAGSLESAILLTETGMLNESLRFEDEFVRHKVLDLIGDLSLIGRPLLGRIEATKAGHGMHTQFVSRILTDSSLWELKTYQECRALHQQ